MGDSECKARILIVEDETIVALDMGNQLADMGFEVVGMAASGEEAIAIASEAGPDLILMDIRLKGPMDGVETAERIRSERDVPIIFITAYADDQTLSRAKITQASGYILKPFQDREVLIAIELALYKHKTEHELRDNREWLQGTLNAIDAALIALDSDDRIVFMNQSAQSLFRIIDEDRRGSPISDLCGFSENDALSDLFKGRTGNAEEAGASWVMLEASWGKLPVEVVRTAISPRKDGSHAGTVLSIRDISELIRAIEIRSRLAAIVANSYDAILTVRPDFHIVSWNFGAELMYGYGSEESMGKSLFDLIPEAKDQERLRSVAERVFSGEETDRFDSVRKCRSGKVIPVSVSLSPVRDAEGRVVELACIERDISAEKEYEASLVKARFVAEEASRLKGEFLSNMSHELRTPLNSIIGMINLSRTVAASPEQREYLEIALQSANSLLFLIGSILDFAKIEAGKMSLNMVPFNLAETIADSIETMSVQAYQKGLYLRFRFDPECPNKVIGDPHRLQQILANLLSNAIKFTERGGIRVDLAFSSGIARFAIRDTGIGIPEDRVDGIWEEFTQVDGSSTRSYGGTGLGLSIVKSLVNLMDGTIGVESEIGLGSVFTVELPFPVAGDSSPTAVRIDALVGEGVAIAVHEEAERAILAELIAAWGAVPFEFCDAKSLMDFLEGKGGSMPRLILADENLPERNLLFSCSEDDYCRKILQDRLVVLVDGLGTKEPLWRSFSRSTRSLIKPVRYEILLEDLLSPVAGGKTEERDVPGPVSAGGDAGSDGRRIEGKREGNALRRVAEIAADAGVKDEIERFLAEIEALGDRPSAHLESAAARCRKTLEDLRTQELPRSLFKVVLACRRDDAEEVRDSLESIRSALRSSGSADGSREDER